VIRVIKFETPNLEKPWSSILNQSNVEWWNWKINFNYVKGLKNIKIKRIKIKIKIQNKFYIYIKGEIEKKSIW
jgi:hypothetical protein